MQIMMNSGGIAGTNAFMVADEVAKKAVIFDAPNDTVGPLVEAAKQRGWEVIGLWLTHGHFDHVADHAVVTAAFPDAKVLIHPLDESKLQDPRSRMFPLPFVIPPRNPDGHVVGGQKLAIGSIEVEVIETPGHAPGHVMFYIPREEVLVGGDLIIMGAIGRTDMPDSDHAALEDSVRRIMKLPAATRLLPGHGQPTTLGEEMRKNLYVREIVGL